MKKTFKKNWILFIPAVSIAIVSWQYMSVFGTIIATPADIEKGYAAFGQFGDYFGGLLNPILAFLNIALISYYQQTSVAKSAEKDVLFRMIDAHAKIVSGIELKSNGESNSGLRAFWIFDSEIKDRYKQLPLKLQDTASKKLDDLVQVYSSYYHDSYKKQYLAHYFRNLYLIFKTIHMSEVFSEEEKQHFAKVVRAQLSHIEQKLLYLNCKLDDGREFRKYVRAFNILEWIDDKEFDNCDIAFSTSNVIKTDIASWS